MAEVRQACDAWAIPHGRQGIDGVEGWVSVEANGRRGENRRSEDADSNGAS